MGVFIIMKNRNLKYGSLVSLFLTLLTFSHASLAQRFGLPAPGNDLIGQSQLVYAKDNETLADVGRRYDVGYYEIVNANPGVSPVKRLNSSNKVIIPSQMILPPGPREGIVINLAELRLFYFPVGANYVITYPIGIGREGGWETPEGETVITAKEENPIWHPTDHVRAEAAKNGYPIPKTFPPGPDNPLGNHLFRLRWPTYLIHGTNQIQSVGGRVSAGCVRLFPSAIKQLYSAVPVGTKVRVVNLAYKTGWSHGALYLEAHPPLAEHENHRQSDIATVRQSVTQLARARRLAVQWETFKVATARQTGVPVVVGS